MKIEIHTAKQVPSLEEVQQKLAQKFGNQYGINPFGWGYGKSVMVKKTSFVGARVFVREKKREIMVQGFFGSLWPAALFGGLLFYGFLYSKWKKMEEEVGEYLKQEYGM